MGDFHGGPVVKNPPSNAGDVGSIPGQRIRSYMPQGNKARGPQLPSLAPQLESPLAANYRKKTHRPQLERSPRAPQRKDPACLNEDAVCGN